MIDIAHNSRLGSPLSQAPAAISDGCSFLEQFTEARPAANFERTCPQVVEIQKAVCVFYRLSLAEMLSDRQERVYAHPRQLAMYLAKMLTPYSLTLIGRIFHRDHTTVIFAVRAVEKRIAEGWREADDCEKIKASLTSLKTQEARRIIAQLRRIAVAGFVRSQAQRNSESMQEYVKALADVPPMLLETAVDRVIRDRTDKYFPLPAEIRAHIRPELQSAERVRSDETVKAVNGELRANGIPVLAT